MKRVELWTMVIMAAAAMACATATEHPAPDLPPRVLPPYTDADVAFMTGMIHHHAQAVLMASWAPSHGASPTLQTLAERIDVSQKDEIALMSRWLRERGLPVPSADPAHSMHGPLMPGMLTPDQLAELDRARGAEFERLFLTFMIRHHQGAITMAEDLFAAPGSAQEDVIFRFASDVYADQMAEIDRMTQMLDNLPSGGR